MSAEMPSLLIVNVEDKILRPDSSARLWQGLGAVGLETVFEALALPP